MDNYPDILEKWQRKFQYIHVDEFQDVGEIEYHLVQLLSKYAIVCVVGDPDQQFIALEEQMFILF